MKPGLVSVTFRQLPPEEIIALCREAGLAGIEWGGDIHVPHGDLAAAQKVGELTRAAGLSVVAYGSYFRLASDKSPAFSDVLASAKALGAPVIRIWAGQRGSADADEAYWSDLIAEALRCADLAGAQQITLAYEFHGGTLTDTLPGALRLLEATRHPFIKSLWQPPVGFTAAQALDTLRQILPWLQHAHVFHWWPDASSRHPLAAGADRWTAYLQEIRSVRPDADLLLEFVREGDPGAFLEDAATLRRLCMDAA